MQGIRNDLKELPHFFVGFPPGRRKSFNVVARPPVGRQRREDSVDINYAGRGFIDAFAESVCFS